MHENISRQTLHNNIKTHDDNGCHVEFEEDHLLAHKPSEHAHVIQSKKVRTSWHKWKKWKGKIFK